MSPETKRIPRIANARKDMADVYRKVRKDSPRAARLLHQRYKAAYEELAADFDRKVYRTTFGSSSVGGLNELFK